MHTNIEGGLLPPGKIVNHSWFQEKRSPEALYISLAQLWQWNISVMFPLLQFRMIEIPQPVFICDCKCK